MAHKSLTSILLGTGSALALAASAHAGALPSGGHFASGKGEIGKVGQSLTVRQSSTTGIINWSSFSIGAKNGVTFDNGHGATLNRVTGGDLSRIAGSLHASGSLYLMNNSGVIVSGTGRVVTGGSFVATSGSLSNSAFGDGRRWIGNAKARVVNHGSITAGGEAKLVGSSVANTGTIAASHVKLRATDGEARAGGTLTAAGSDAHILVISDKGLTKVTGVLAAHNANGSGGEIETSGQTVSIGGDIDAGKGGTWLVDPKNLTVDSTAAATIDDSLNAGTNVTLHTTASGTSGPGHPSNGPGDIIVDSALSWSTTAALTLDAYHSVQIDALIASNGLGGLNLVYDHGGSDGRLSFEKGRITFASDASTLEINGNQYILVSNLTTLGADVARDFNANVVHNYALANDYEASQDGVYSNSPVRTSFYGQFDGLGNQVSGLKIETSDGSEGNIGLFAMLQAGGSISDLTLSGIDYTLGASVGAGAVGGLVGESLGSVYDVAVTGRIVSKNGAATAGLLIGQNDGNVSDTSVSGSLTGPIDYAGGLVGWAETDSAISSSSAAVNVEVKIGDEPYNYSVGGFAGKNDGTVENAIASGSVQGGSDIGGFVGTNLGKISHAAASGTVETTKNVAATVGGFVGENGGTSNSISWSSSTGNVEAVDPNDGLDAGGFVGDNNGGQIRNSYSTGNVDGGHSHTVGSENIVGGFAGTDNSGETIARSYSTGNVNATGDAIIIGGFVGGVDVSSSGNSLITNSYETGTVTTGKGLSVVIGGFAGENFGMIERSYAVGAVFAPHSQNLGIDGFADGKASDCYWDRKTTGIATSEAGKGVTTAKLTGALLKGFSSKTWAIDPSINNGFPYLIALKSSY